MRFWLLALAEPNRIAAQVLTSSPMNVRTLGLIRERASQRTMVSSRTPQARPKAEVQLMDDDSLIGDASAPYARTDLRQRRFFAAPEKRLRSGLPHTGGRG